MALMMAGITTVFLFVLLRGAAVVKGLDRTRGELQYLATHDPLTGVANRTVILERLDAATKHRSNGAAVAVIYVDIDGFKAINDAYGHRVGDDVLVEIAHRLSSSVRARDLVSRLGGDEFAVLVEDMSVQELHQLAARVMHALNDPFVGSGKVVPLTASIGVWCSRSDTAETLLQRADEEMYKAKSRRKNHGATSGVALQTELATLEHVLVASMTDQTVGTSVPA